MCSDVRKADGKDLKGAFCFSNLVGDTEENLVKLDQNQVN